MKQNLLRGRRRRPRATMTDRQFIEWMRDQCDVQLGTDPDGGGGDVESPTGRKPRLVWTPALQRTYNRMMEEGEAGDDTLGAIWYRVIKSNAAADRYGDQGTWATLMYQMTGDPQWVEHAWRQLEPMFSSALDDDNNTREYAEERVLLFDWLWPGLSEDQRAQMFEALDRMFGNAGLDGGVRLNDSDQCTGVYFGALFYGHAFGDVHQPARDFFNLAHVGGLDATSVDIKTTMRNAVAWFVQAAAGGEWIESSDYNLGTVRLLMLGWAGAKTVLGADHFPEIAAWMASGAKRYPLMVTPDFEQSVQWGDEQHPRDLLGWKWSSTAMMFDDPIARRFVYDLVEKLGPTGSYSAEPTVPRAFLLFDPYGPQQELDTPTLDARGQGIITSRTPNGSMLGAHFPPTPTGSSVDHLVNYFGDFQLYRGAGIGWALTHPICYGNPVNDGRAVNGTLHRGQGAPKEFRNVVSYGGNDWRFIAGTCGGTILASKFYQPPPTFWHEWSRSLLWIQGEVDTFIVFDRSHLDDPLTLPNCSKYDDATEKEFNSNPLRLWRWHCPVPPTIAGNCASWPVLDEQARVTWLRDDLDASIEDQSVLWASINMLASERKFHLNLVPADEAPGFETLATVLEFGDPSKFSTGIRLHRDDANCVHAVELTRSGRVTWAALFSTTPGPKLPTYGGNSAYHPEIPGLLAGVRFRDYPLPAASARIWGIETASGVPTHEP